MPDRVQHTAEFERPVAHRGCRAIAADHPHREVELLHSLGRGEAEAQLLGPAVLDPHDAPSTDIERVERHTARRVGATALGRRGPFFVRHQKGGMLAARGHELKLQRVRAVRLGPVDHNVVALARLERVRQPLDRDLRNRPPAMAHATTEWVVRRAGEVPPRTAALDGRLREQGGVGKRTRTAAKRARKHARGQ
ncbi:MAG: hypothetical protein OXU20_39700 [Myxococcales bacterium]|nr:hypothetical protein [Myxococcales bacterium]